MIVRQSQGILSIKYYRDCSDGLTLQESRAFIDGIRAKRRDGN